MYIGQPADLNIGNGKTVSAVGEVISRWLEDENKQIFSNIKLIDIPYSPFSPENIEEVLETEDSLVILDELHAIVHKNHRISERCKNHSVPGLCYRLAQFFRQIRKRNSDTFSTVQTFSDSHYQYRMLSQRQIVCEKYNLQNNVMRKCDADKCPEEHVHFIKQKLYQNFRFIKDLPIYDPEPFYRYYDSFEIVDGWVSYGEDSKK